MELTPVHPLITVQADGMWVAHVTCHDLHLASSQGVAVIREMLAAERTTDRLRRFTSWKRGPNELTLELLSEERSAIFTSTLPYRPGQAYTPRV